MKSTFCLMTVLLGILAALASAEEPAGPVAKQPLKLKKGVHLLLDDHYIARSTGVERRVYSPKRFLDEPVVTGALAHQNWQPFFTVLHDPTASPKNPFRMWYNVDVVDDPADGAYFGISGLLESADGVRWPGPYERLNSLSADGRVRFGANVLDEGPGFREKSERYKMLYFDAGKVAGPRVAFSANGRQWTLHDGGKPVIPTNNGDDIWSAGFDPVRHRYYLFGKTFAPFTWTNLEGKKLTASIRRYFTCTSPDFKTWSEPRMVFAPDEKDQGITQWYGPAGFMVRGDLLIGFLRVLRDDLSAAGVPPEAVAANTKGPAGLGASGLEAAGAGMGYTVLTWSRDGQTWFRDRHTDPFLEPDPRVGAWDHAMAWVGSSVLVDDEVYLHYAGYRWGHKYRHAVDRQIGLVKMQRDRFVARQAGERGGTITTPPLVLGGDAIALNVDAQGGEVRLQMSTADGKPIPGFRFDDCRPISTDSLAAPVTWEKPLSTLRGTTVQLEFSLKKARLFAFEVQ